MCRENAALIAAQIDVAFREQAYPAGPLVADTYDDEGITDYFTGKPWTAHSPEALRQRESALCFFSDEAFCYFLPAYMHAVLLTPERADVIVDVLQAVLLPPKADLSRPAFARKWQRFSPAQKQVIVLFLLAIRAETSSDAALVALAADAGLAI
ncbi:hypothetical protein SAMN02745857_03051 [Andreprevotia lacus DSM 23236]|jgi:hypothetical protein|uniref:Uncharacterized protein n=1 Tax=Andreprevotia lacus DSM 23236 TaxID=1121001 RepID=A0A1W1XVU4_9NEIS|nr:DUF6714 family protein [Andreprevotia lacus]SMC27954.1 hypothetical protein SAMN02745857_03051 [Andreprevotia lacus DSM 23236]